MKKNPISVDKDMLASQALYLMNKKELQVYVFMVVNKKITRLALFIFIIF